MVSQAVAFNMFLAFFPTPLVALGLVSSSLRGKSGQELAMRLSEILPPGQLAARIRITVATGSERMAVGISRLGRDAARWLAGDEAHHGSIQLIYGDHERHSFLGRQLRGLILFAVSVVAWLVAVALSVFGGPVRQWMIRGFGKSPLVRDFWNIMFSGLGNDRGDDRPGLDLSRCATGRNDLEFRPSRSGSGDDSVVGHQFAAWTLRPKYAVRTCLQRCGCGDRLDGVDGILCDDRLSGCSLECRKCCTVRLSFGEHLRR